MTFRNGTFSNLLITAYVSFTWGAVMKCVVNVTDRILKSFNSITMHPVWKTDEPATEDWKNAGAKLSTNAASKRMQDASAATDSNKPRVDVAKRRSRRSMKRRNRACLSLSCRSFYRPCAVNTSAANAWPSPRGSESPSKWRHQAVARLSSGRALAIAPRHERPRNCSPPRAMVDRAPGRRVNSWPQSRQVPPAASEIRRR